MAGTTKNLEQFYLEATPTIDTNAYVSGDLIGSAAIELAGAVPGDNSSAEKHGGLIQSVIVTDLASQSASLDIMFFDTDPTNTTFTDNAAFDPDDLDLVNCIGVVSVTDWKSFSDSSMGQALQLALPFVLAAGSSLYAVIVSRGTPTYAATSLSLRVGILRT